MAPHHLPFYLAPGSGTDVLMVVMGIFLVTALIWVGTLYLRLHSLPERMAHKSEKLQFEIVAILGLLALFTFPRRIPAPPGRSPCTWSMASG
jgi:hypothetical protein